jgi:hypothetical protein
MDWWKPLAVLAVGSLALVAVGSLAGLARAVAGSVAALAVVVLLVVTVLAWNKMGTEPPRLLSTPYWGRRR